MCNQVISASNSWSQVRSTGNKLQMWQAPAGNSTEGENEDQGVEGANKEPMARGTFFCHYHSIQDLGLKKINFSNSVFKYHARKPVHSKMEYLFLDYLCKCSLK